MIKPNRRRLMFLSITLSNFASDLLMKQGNVVVYR